MQQTSRNYWLDVFRGLHVPQFTCVVLFHMYCNLPNMMPVTGLILPCSHRLAGVAVSSTPSTMGAQEMTCRQAMRDRQASSRCPTEKRQLTGRQVAGDRQASGRQAVVDRQASGRQCVTGRQAAGAQQKSGR